MFGHAKWITLSIILTITAAPSIGAAKQRQEKKFAVSVSEITPQEALLREAKGEKVYLCETQELKLSKSGTSFNSRKVKKALSKEDVERQIKELQERAE